MLACQVWSGQAVLAGQVGSGQVRLCWRVRSGQVRLCLTRVVESRFWISYDTIISNFVKFKQSYNFLSKFTALPCLLAVEFVKVGDGSKFVRSRSVSVKV